MATELVLRVVSDDPAVLLRLSVRDDIDRTVFPHAYGDHRLVLVAFGDESQRIDRDVGVPAHPFILSQRPRGRENALLALARSAAAAPTR